MADVRALYLDLDGTLLGPSGSLFEDADGHWSPDGLRALEACARAGVEVVPMSGRSHARVAEVARLLGASSYVAEAGALVAIDGETHWLTGDFQPTARDGTVHEQIAASGAPALLQAHFTGRLEPHEPWTGGRAVSHVLRGLVDIADAERLLETNGHGNLQLLDNGPSTRRSAALAALADVRVYHLLPRPACKAAGVGLHRRLRRYETDHCAVIGDSLEDLAVATEVRHAWLVANAALADPALTAAAAAYPNVRFTRGRYAAGVLEAVTETINT